MKSYSLKYTFLFLLLLGSIPTIQAQKIAVKTDALLLATMTPNVGAELIVGNRTSVCLGVFANSKPWGKDIKMVGVVPELRYWFNGRPLIREYVGIAALATNYDITWDENRYKGDALGVGISLGYAWRVGERFAIECYGSCGLVYFNHKLSNIYDNQEDYVEFESVHNKVSGVKIFPTKLGVSVTYIIK